ncbi:MAG: hypothetical protein KUG81_10305 [Gammaproteobacteria bacterium]|nr:hypothetical protein [Gammaproteobacteria bacterium]
MATLQELRGLFNDSDLLEKVEAATVIAANNLLAGTPTADQKAWAAAVATNPNTEGKKALMFVLAENEGLSVSAIQSAGDGAIQNNVDDIAQVLADGLAGV